MRTLISRVMMTLEPTLLRLDEQPSAAVYRVLVGFGFFPVSAALAGDRLTGGPLLAAFVILLMTLRGVPAVLRMVVPFSPGAVSVWFERRQLAKRFDSYQWQKLFWIGLGLMAYLWFADDRRSSAIALAVVSVGAGLAGLITWRTRITDCDTPPPTPERLQA